MRIGCITTSVIPSKTANSIQAVKVCHALKQNGHDVHLWAPDFYQSNWKEIAEVYGVSDEFGITWVSFSKSFKQYDFSFKSVNSSIIWGSEIIYTWALQAAVFANLLKIPTVMEFHDFPMGFMGPKLFKLLMRLKTKKLIMTTTRALADGIEERFNVIFDPDTLMIAPNGTDPERYASLPGPAKAREILGLNKGITVGFTGHFYPGRGIDLLVKIACAMPEVNFIWVGGRDSDILRWQKKLEARSIGNVTMTGFIPNIHLPMYQAAADILVMPYGKKIEGSSGGNIARVINPMKMFDYLSAGRPIIASNIPVFHEVLNDTIAVFCEPDDPDEWVSAIRYLATDETLRSSMRKAALKTSKSYSWKNRAKSSMNRITSIIK